MPVGFKWFVPGLIDGSIGFGGEESAGASFLRRDGSVWTTDKDGILLALLAAEILAVTGIVAERALPELSPNATVRRSTNGSMRRPPEREGRPRCALRRAVSADGTRRRPDHRRAHRRAGQRCSQIGGLKVVTENAWFAARPSGTEDVYKIYAESFRGPDHLAEVQNAARTLVTDALAGSG